MATLIVVKNNSSANKRMKAMRDNLDGEQKEYLKIEHTKRKKSKA